MKPRAGELCSDLAYEKAKRHKASGYIAIPWMMLFQSLQSETPVPV